MHIDSGRGEALEGSRYVMNTGKAAAVLGVCRQTVRNYAADGTLSHQSQTRGKQRWLRFDPQEVAALADELRRRATRTQ